eukprot:COSAG05_NODE_13453_length_430_cov_0.595166_2_plen_33_part_01
MELSGAILNLRLIDRHYRDRVELSGAILNLRLI